MKIDVRGVRSIQLVIYCNVVIKSSPHRQDPETDDSCTMYVNAS